MLSERGQAAFFVILGFIMVFLAIGIYYAYYSAIAGPKMMDMELEDLNQYVQGCVDKLLRDAVTRRGHSNYDDFEDAVESHIYIYLETCANVSEYLRNYPGISIRKTDVTKVNAILREDKSTISVKVEFPFVIKKGNNEHTLTSFYSEYSFIKKACIMIAVDNDCRALEASSGNLLGIEYDYQPGDSVVIGGRCRAC